MAASFSHFFFTSTFMSEMIFGFASTNDLYLENQLNKKGNGLKIKKKSHQCVSLRSYAVKLISCRSVYVHICRATLDFIL